MALPIEVEVTDRLALGTAMQIKAKRADFCCERRPAVRLVERCHTDLSGISTECIQASGGIYFGQVPRPGSYRS